MLSSFRDGVVSGGRVLRAWILELRKKPNHIQDSPRGVGFAPPEILFSAYHCRSRGEWGEERILRKKGLYFGDGQASTIADCRLPNGD
jgi:hypothetical protein